MKKQITAILTAMLILGSLTGCGGGNSTPISNNTSSTENDSANFESKTESTPETKPPSVYGEAEIPNIPCGSGNFEGRASELADAEALKQCLDSMFFETHTVGDYKISLVGKRVRTDKENFPKNIYAGDLYVEVEKNGAALEKEDLTSYSGLYSYGSQTLNEFILNTDKIGNYIDLYELEQPVIAMRYYFYDGIEREVTKSVEFLTVCSGKVNTAKLAESAKGTGVGYDGAGKYYNSEMPPDKFLMINDKEDITTVTSLFAADKFNITDNKTLVDEDAKIRYVFNFSKTGDGVSYNTEKLT